MCRRHLFLYYMSTNSTPAAQEVEKLRVLLKRGAGIGTPADDYTPYTGLPAEEMVERTLKQLNQESSA